MDLGKTDSINALVGFINTDQGAATIEGKKIKIGG
jgi:ABC-type branched-subunit amino acid transport system ATPase component